MSRAHLLTGVGVGASLAYLFDSDRGRRRRAQIRDTAVKTLHRAADAADTTRRDLANRVVGTAAEVRARFGDEQADDRILTERVRSKLGRLVAHPHAIVVDVQDAVVTLKGPILEAEAPRLLRTIEDVRGVREVINQLEEHTRADSIPSLQGGATPNAPRPDVLLRHWAPATRFLVGSAGVALTATGVARRGPVGALLMLGGLGLVARSATNLDARRQTGITARRAIDVQKTITINAPVEDVYTFWTAYGNFPRFMSRVLEVRPSTREGQSHWKVVGPAGLPVEFDAEVTQAITNEVFGWRTIDGAVVGHGGLVHFDRNPRGGTRVQIRMSYSPPGGWFGHGVAAAFGVDPKSSLDADLVRMKRLIETGRIPHDAAQGAAREVPVLIDADRCEPKEERNGRSIRLPG